MKKNSYHPRSDLLTSRCQFPQKLVKPTQSTHLRVSDIASLHTRSSYTINLPRSTRNSFLHLRNDEKIKISEQVKTLLSSSRWNVETFSYGSSWRKIKYKMMKYWNSSEDGLQSKIMIEPSI